MSSQLLAVLILSFICIVTYVVHEIIANRYQRLQFSWHDAMCIQSKKNHLIPVIQKISTENINYERRILPALIDARAALDLLTVTGIDTNNLIDAEIKLKWFVAKAQQSSADFPHIAESEAFQNVMNEMAELQLEAKQVLADYNQTVSSYNKMLSLFPFSLINWLLNRKPRVELFSETKFLE